MKLIILTLLFGLLGYSISKPLDTKDATEALVEIEKQRLIKFPEELEQPSAVEGKDKHDEAKRILQEIEKINQALGYVKKQADPTRSPAILDSSQYLFPNTGYQPFHVQSPQMMGANGETLLLPSIRSVKLDSVTYNKASEYNVPPTRKTQKQTKPNGEKPKEKPTPISFYFKPNRVEVPAPQTKAEEKLLPTHFVIPVRLYKHNKQQYLEKHTPQEYKIKGYKIVGDIDHFYGKTKFNKTTVAPNSTAKSTPKYHLFFLPEEIVAKNSLNDIKAVDSNSNETSSREEKLANRPNKAQSKSQPISASSTANTTNPPQIVRKRLGTKSKGNSNSVVSASSSTVVKITPTGTGQGTQVQIQQEQQPQQPTPSQQITQVIQAPQPTTVFTSSSQATKPSNANNNNSGNKNPLRPFLNVQTNNNNNNDNPNNNNNNNNNNPLRPFLNFQNNNNNNNGIKNRPLLELQNNINNINNATSNAIKTAFQNIFRLPFRQQDPNKPLNTVTEFPTIETMPLPAPQHNQHTVIQQSYNPFTTSSSAQLPPLPFYGNNDDFQNDHLDSDYKWDDENSSNDNSNSEDQYNYNGSLETEPEEKKIFGNLLKHRQEQQKEALKQGGIIIQRLKVRKGGIAIAGPGGVATAGSGGTAIVGPGGYALTHPRSLTIAGPGAKVIAIPSDVDLKDALQRTNLETKMFPREGRIVATGPAVYYAPPTGDYVEI